MFIENIDYFKHANDYEQSLTLTDAGEGELPFKHLASLILLPAFQIIKGMNDVAAKTIFQ